MHGLQARCWDLNEVITEENEFWTLVDVSVRCLEELDP